MSWDDDTVMLAEAMIDQDHGFGEPVTLPSGLTALGVFDLFDPYQVNAGVGVGLPMRLDQQPNPRLMLGDVVAAELAEGDTLTVRGVAWKITRIDADGTGLSAVLLMPSQPTESADAFKRWR